jgi:hypothetical protein
MRILGGFFFEPLVFLLIQAPIVVLFLARFAPEEPAETHFSLSGMMLFALIVTYLIAAIVRISFPIVSFLIYRKECPSIIAYLAVNMIVCYLLTRSHGKMRDILFGFVMIVIPTIIPFLIWGYRYSVVSLQRDKK